MHTQQNLNMCQWNLKLNCFDTILKTLPLHQNTKVIKAFKNQYIFPQVHYKNIITTHIIQNFKVANNSWVPIAPAIIEVAATTAT